MAVVKQEKLYDCLTSKLDCHNDEIVQVAEDANALDFIRDQKDREEHDDKPDAMLERIDNEQTVDIFNFTQYLRTRRINMVQSFVSQSGLSWKAVLL